MLSLSRLFARIALIAALAGATSSNASPATDLVFSAEALNNIPARSEVTYLHERSGTGEKLFHPVNGTASLRLQPGSDGNQVILTMREDGKLRSQTPFPADVGNPLVMAFLEYTLRSMAQSTGGSPFYLRNRIKDSLRSGGTVENVTVKINGEDIKAQDVVFRPFMQDPNAPKMGDFARLELHFVVAQSVPGGFVRFQAATPDRDGKRLYREVIEYATLSRQE